MPGKDETAVEQKQDGSEVSKKSVSKELPGLSAKTTRVTVARPIATNILQNQPRATNSVKPTARAQKATANKKGKPVTKAKGNRKRKEMTSSESEPEISDEEPEDADGGDSAQNSSAGKKLGAVIYPPGGMRVGLTRKHKAVPLHPDLGRKLRRRR